MAHARGVTYILALAAREPSLGFRAALRYLDAPGIMPNATFIPVKISKLMT
jgi:hypothetical protein